MRLVTKLRLVQVGVIAVAAMGAAAVAYMGYGALIERQQQTALGLRAASEGRRLEAAIDELRRDAHLAANLPVIVDAARGEARPEAIHAVYTELLRAKPYYDHVRLISGDGAEVARVNRTPTGLVAVPETDLQPKGHRDYVRAGLMAAPDTVYLHEITLNRESGTIEIPPRPMLRAVAPIDRPDGTRFGIAVINMDVARLLKGLFPLGDPSTTYYIADTHGDFLLHPEPEKMFGRELGHGYSRADEFAGAGAAEGLHAGGAIHAEPLRVGASLPELTLILRTDFANIPVRTMDGAVRLLGLAGLLVCLALGSSWFLSQLATRPIEELTQAAHELGRVVDDHRAGGGAPTLPTDRSDEAGILARAMNGLLMSIDAKRRGLAEANEQLERANHRLEHFVHVASHDLREPVRRIALLTDMLLRNAGADGGGGGGGVGGVGGVAGDELLRSLGEMSERMVDQITGVRELASVGRAGHELVDVDLNERVRGVLEDFEESLTARGVEVDVAPLPVVRAAPGLIDILYSNLVRNALAHTGRGPFRLGFGGEAEADGRWRLWVVNTGSTIPPVEHKSVLDPFVRGSNAGDGTGLGLSICRTVVETLGGDLWVESGDDDVQVNFRL